MILPSIYKIISASLAQLVEQLIRNEQVVGSSPMGGSNYINMLLIYSDLQYAIKANASGTIICHNHPSGNVQPSESDMKITRKIKDFGNLIDVQLLDHLIVIPEEGYYSMVDEGIV